MESINLITGDKYKLPNNNDDSQNIDDFLLRNKNKKIVVVQGLGFVGSVMSLVCANSIESDYAVIGIDLLDKQNYWKIKSINEGVFPVISSDNKINEYFSLVKEKNNFYATYDDYVYSKADIIIVDINLDVKKESDFNKNLLHYDVDLSSFKNAIKTIGNNCKEKVLILVETTVPPGTTEKIILPIIKKCIKKRKKNIDNILIGHSYERVMPGPNYIDSIINFYRVYSGINERSANAVESFLKTIIKVDEYPLVRLGNTNATEMAKVLENSYRSMNIAFMVEWSRFAEESGVNLYEVIEAIRMRPTHSNLMFPGIGVGGYCLTKDPLLASWSKKNIFLSEKGLHQSEKGVKINDKMPLYAFRYLKKICENMNLPCAEILMLGISYRSDVGDTRYTPVENLYNYLIAYGCNILLHDFYISYWEEKDLSIVKDLTNLLKKSIDVIIFSTAHTDYKNNKELIGLILSKDRMLIFDTVGVLSNYEIEILSKKHIVRVVGRGDLYGK